MHTICPACVTRISDKARFCHSCGDAISSAADLGTGTELACPACGGDERLQARSLGTNLSVSECGRCAGLWLDNQTFERAVTRAEEVSTTIHGHAKAERRAEQTLGEPKRGPAYRPCVRCGKLMNRQNYGKRSNVIVDACKEHGVWFDAHELGQILDWVRSGGLEKMREVEEQKLRDERRRRAMEPPSIPMTAPGAPDNDGRPDLLVELLKLFW